MKPGSHSQPSFTHALLVEDEVNLAEALKIAIRRMGIEPIHARTIAQANELFSARSPDLIVLDRQLPDGDGIEFCEALRAKGYVGMILMLTAKGDTPERVRGLQAGADDYLAKPFSWEELSARIFALSRRRPAPAFTSASPAIGESTRPSLESPELWARDEKRLRIHGPHGWIELTPLEFKLAIYLMNANGEIVSREQLLKHVWGFTLLPKTRTVDHFLGRLRKHFEKDPDQPVHFVTVRGAGYRFVSS